MLNTKLRTIVENTSTFLEKVEVALQQLRELLRHLSPPPDDLVIGLFDADGVEFKMPEYRRITVGELVAPMSFEENDLPIWLNKNEIYFPTATREWPAIKHIRVFTADGYYVSTLDVDSARVVGLGGQLYFKPKTLRVFWRVPQTITLDQARELIERMKAATGRTCEKCERAPMQGGVVLFGDWEEDLNVGGLVKRCDICKTSRKYPWAEKLDPERVLRFMREQPGMFELKELEALL